MRSQKVIKHVLSNGLTVLIKPDHTVPKVSTQLWYHVGSKDEKNGERGIAHLIEHMIFKGTKRLSECDINLITHKLSGYTNAFTSFDYTGYLFDFPSQHWQEALPIMADCMHNCTFKEEFLNSELKAVIQELKMYKDDAMATLCESLVSAIFEDHPYHYPIIGFKQDLWSVSRDTLIQFYKRHYVPNNATLIMVGDVNPDEALKLSRHAFGHIKQDTEYTREDYYHSPDLKTQSVTLYRDLKSSQMIVAWVIPGAKTGNAYIVDIVSLLIADGKGSRLYKKLVDDLQLVTDFDTFTYDLFDYGVLFLYFQPKELSLIDQILKIIQEELQLMAQTLVSEKELTRAIKKKEVEHLALLESNQKQAYALGTYFLATHDEQFLYTYTERPKDHLAYEVRDFIQSYLRPSLMHRAAILPLSLEDRDYWLKLQEISDQEDERVLAGRVRTEGVEGARCAADIQAQPPKPFTFPRAQTLYLDNGLKVLYYHTSSLPKIDLILDFEAKYQYDPVGKEGLSSFVALMLLEGTKNYSAQTLIDTLESFGMTIQSSAGYLSLSMLSVDFEKGLELLNEILVHATFLPEAIEKVRAQMLADLDEFWDTPTQFIIQLAKQEVYKGHPYSKNSLGTLEGLKQIQRADLESYYKKYVSPRAARLAIVGDLAAYNIQEVLGQKFGSWQGDPIEQLEYPPIEPVKKHEVAYPILRDQTVLAYAGLSAARTDEEYDALLLFDQVFTGGVLNSMASRLFDLREQSGLFYTIGGSLVHRSDKQKGLILIKTIVSNDRLKEAERAIEQVINTAIDTLSDDELTEARQAVVNSLVDNFSSYYLTAQALLFKDRFNLPDDYFDKRADTIRMISKDRVEKVVKKYLTTQSMAIIRAGRV